MRPLAAVLLLLAACSSSAPVTLTPEDERTLRPIPDMNPDVRRLVANGDGFFVDALAPHRKGETVAALDLYAKARASYLEAQTHYSGIVPQPLLDRVRECVIRIAALQRQRHSSP